MPTVRPMTTDASCSKLSLKEVRITRYAGLEWALNTALDLYAQPAHWMRMVRNGMRCDFSWQHQGAEYVALYSRLMG